MGVVHDHPDELLGPEVGRGDHEAIHRSVWQRSFIRHDENMTAVLTFRKRLMR
jgi:hypothetical protein